MKPIPKKESVEDKVKTEDEINDKKEPEVKTPPEPEVKTPTEPLISVDVYCGSLDNSGVDRFADVMLQSEINKGTIPAGNKTRTEWESLYLKIKNS